MKKSGILLLGGMLLAFSLCGCSRSDAQEPDMSSSGSTAGKAYTECREPRPEICYEIYAPVCATRDTGVRCVTTPCPSEEKVTFSNDCTACADSRVRGFVDGVCR